MADTLEKALKKQIENVQEDFKNLEETKSFEEAIWIFEELVKKGLVSKRGNNMPTSADIASALTSFSNFRSSSSA